MIQYKKYIEQPTASINITNTSAVDVTIYASAQVVDANLTADKIKKNVTILGITGSYEGLIPTGTLNVASNGIYDVTNYASARVAVPSGEGITVYVSDVEPTAEQGNNGDLWLVI